MTRRHVLALGEVALVLAGIAAAIWLWVAAITANI